ncbi:hypothetical protein ElyMa_003961600 [Elysia marginata]|uniref:Uncharacterized protein n=1 Tax=Elysia marginata TaxID=1093978 RepID=A0AAV4FVQ9_9GAST|nr:hypothetical protein ElyMa_003961600 [Elysia marginata]
MTSKVENHDPAGSSSTNQKRRHSTGQGQRSKTVHSDIEHKRIKDDHSQHGLTNGHAFKDERRASSESSNSKTCSSDNNKENAHGQNFKEEGTEKKKKKKRKKKKGGGGGGGAGGGNAVKGNGTTNGSEIGATDAELDEAKSLEIEDTPGKGRLTHTSSEEHSDEIGSAHTEDACDTDTLPNSQNTARDTPTPEPKHAAPVEREAFDSSIDEGSIIDTESSTSINNSANRALEAQDEDDGCTEQKAFVSETNNALASSLSYEKEVDASPEQNVMSRTVVLVDEGSSVDATHNDDPAYFEGKDLYIQEASDFSEKKISQIHDHLDFRNWDNSKTYPTDSSVVEDASRNLSDGLQDPLKVKDIIPIMCKTEEARLSESLREYNLVPNSSENSPSTDDSENTSLGNEQEDHGTKQCDAERVSREDSCEQDKLVDVQSGVESEQREDNSRQDSVPVEQNSRHTSIENCLAIEMDSKPKMPRDNEDDLPNGVISHSCYQDGISSDNHKSREQVDDHVTSISKREISIVDLIGARATAGSAIRAGIIQDMMLNSGNPDHLESFGCSGSSGDQPSAASSSASKSDITGDLPGEIQVRTDGL